MLLNTLLLNTKLYHSLLVLYYKVLYNSCVYYSVVCYSILYYSVLYCGSMLLSSLLLNMASMFYDSCHYVLVTSRWFSPGSPVSSTYKTDRHDITEILLKVALNTIDQTNKQTII
jgi:hypothetical protein